jgi:hypothetical protein
MRTIVGAGGISIFLTGKEWNLLKEKSEIFLRSSLDEMQKYTASQMHRKGILSAKKINNDTQYKLNGKLD